MDSYRKTLLIFIVTVAVIETAAVLAFGLGRPAWNDEEHFLRTVEYFGQEISLSTLTHYNEMSTPLPFVAYALWGRLVGFELSHLRILTLICALITYLIFFQLLWQWVDNPRVIFWSSLIFIANPYMIGLSLFIYTDMMTIMFFMLAVYAHVNRRVVLFGVATAMAVLCRQYVAFLLLATVVWNGLRYVWTGKAVSVRMILAGLAAMIPYGLLVLLWGGLSADNTMRAAYLANGISFHLSFVTLYVCQIFVFQSPLIVVRFREFYGDYRIVLGSLLLSFAYYLYPVEAVKSIVYLENYSVGLFHRFLKYTLPNEALVHVAFQVCFFLAIPVVVYLIRDSIERLRRRQTDLPLLLNLAVFSFFLVMPLSYFAWEKYFLLLVPLMILRLLLIKNARVLAAGV